MNQSSSIGSSGGILARRPQLVSMIGSLLEYYDSSLYGFLVPILAPIFLPEMDPVNAMIIGYAMYPLGILSRPFGAYWIGRIGDLYGRKRALTVSITGTAIATGCIGFLPGYAQIGLMAPLILTILRLLQKFFVAGEYNGGAIYALEHTKERKGLCSGLYCAFTATGILVASGMAALVAHLPEGAWRGAYFLAFGTALLGLYLRKKAPETPEFLESEAGYERPLPFWGMIRVNWREIVPCVGVAGFFSTLYCISAIFLNGFIPKLTSYTAGEILQLNTLSMVAYVVGLGVFGRISDRIGLERQMVCTTIVVIVAAYPLFGLISRVGLGGILAVKVVFALMTAAYVAPFHAWIQEKFAVRSRYQVISLTYSLGSQLGAMTPALAMGLWKWSGWSGVPGLVIVFSGILGVWSFYSLKKTKRS